MQGTAPKQSKTEGRIKRKESDRVFKRKKKMAHVVYTRDEIDEIFKVDIPVHLPLKLLPCPLSFLRQMHRTFKREFPNFQSSAKVMSSIMTEELEVGDM